MANTTGYGYLLGPAPQFFDANGKPLVGGKLFVYIAGTTTKAVTYSDFYQTENTNPVVLNDLGTCMLIVPSANLYKIVLYDRKGNLLITRDNVSVSSEQKIIYTTANKVDSSDSTVDVTATTDPDTGIITYDLSIKDEIDRAKEAEKGLADAIEAEKKRAEGVESTLSKSIADETYRATEAEKGLADAIDAEKKRAEEAERTLSESISEETERAIKAEKASRTEIVAGDNITVDKTVGADGQDVYTVSGESKDNLVDDVRVNGASVVTDKVANIDVPVAGTASPLMDGKASVGNSLKYAREDHVHPSDTSREDIANKTAVVLGTSDSKYPTDKAVAEFVNSSIATNTANYISNNGEPFTSVEQLEAYSGPVTNNDYAFVTGTDSEGNTYYDRYKATVSGETVTWALEYRLNNSSFTAAQWSAINSGITSALVAKIHTHSNKDVLDGITSSDIANWNSKQNSLTAGDNITIDGNTISSDQVFVATYGTTKYAEVKAAFDDGKICTVFKNERYYYIKQIFPESITFASSTASSVLYSLTVYNTDRWSSYTGHLQSRLTFDSAPKAGSNNPVTSDGIKKAIDAVNAKGLTIKEISGEQVICFE